MLRKTLLILKSASLLLLSQILVSTNVHAQTPVIGYTSVITGLNFPVDVVNAGDGTNRIFIVEQGGVVKVFDAAYASLGNFVTVSGVSTGGERGLLSMAFHPDYETNGFFFVYYTNAVGSIEVARYHTDPLTPNVADASSKQIVITIPHPGQSNHNGGKLNFGADGYLYFATGDGGGANDPSNNAQSGASLLGKMIRIAVSTGGAPFYTIPGTNPYVSDPTVLDEIYSFGLRNPFRWSFDRLTHDMWIGDVGQDAREEINYKSAGTASGANFGWDCFEGTITNVNASNPICPVAYTPPVYTYSHTGGTYAVTGGVVYRGSDYPLLNGYYLATDYYTGILYKLKQNSGGTFTVTTQAGVTGVPAFGEAEDGEIFALAQGAAPNAGILYALSVTSTLPTNLLSFTVNSASDANELQWKIAREVNVKEYIVEYSLDGKNFSDAGSVPAKAATSYQFRHVTNVDRKIFYRLKMVDIGDGYKYSAIIVSRAGRNDEAVTIYPTVSSGQPIQIHLNVPFNSLKIFNVHGQLVHQQNPGNRTGVIYLDVKSLRTGTYTISLQGSEGPVVRKFVIR
ncbi:MAG TPA: PQQ-dependent sugar dehydrogenase [Chitinophagaceae bacterium]|nr:PQQ-dependent sugar dehydrogenase [Chitinophagaceae bacterium]